MNLPDFKFNEDEIPDIKIKNIRFQNYKVFTDHTFEFDPKFSCFVGSNGSGKTTVLDCIQNLFSRYDKYELDRLIQLLGKSVRHVDKSNGAYDATDFMITANIESSLGDYQIQLNKSGFIKDHPQEIKAIVYRLCFYTHFDSELYKFQMPRNKWKVFKNVFELITGYEIEEKTTLFSEDDIITQKYVLGFDVKKPNETISNKECSAGEKKVIASLSTLLNKEYVPRIILIDNIEMHIEPSRHLYLIDAFKNNFPNSQIFVTTHSQTINKKYRKSKQLHDLRLVNYPTLIKKEKWRLFLADEIVEYMNRLNGVENKLKGKIMEQGERLKEKCFDLSFNNSDFKNIEIFMKDCVSIFVEDICTVEESK